MYHIMYYISCSTVAEKKPPLQQILTNEFQCFRLKYSPKISIATTYSLLFSVFWMIHTGIIYVVVISYWLTHKNLIILVLVPFTPYCYCTYALQTTFILIHLINRHSNQCLHQLFIEIDSNPVSHVSFDSHSSSIPNKLKMKSGKTYSWQSDA